MQIEFTGRHVEMTPAIRAHVEEHFRKLDTLFDGASTANAHVIIDVVKNRHRGEVIVHWRGHTLTANDTNADMYQALTRAIDKIEKQAVKLKKRVTERKKGAPSLSTLAPDDLGATEAADDEPRRDEPRIVNARRYNVKPMTPDEAAMQLAGQQDEQFIVFRDADSERFSVLYKRKDGNYGLIQP